MDSKKRNRIIRISCVVLALVILTGVLVHVSGSTRYFSGEAEVYYQSLLEKGFPEDYAVSLTELHLLHPNWSFTPLLITEGKSSYTWDYVIKREMEESDDNNLISANDSYKAYRHPTNTTLYDASSYQASKNALEYFMDPRNFLNETDIFQFYDLASSGEVAISAIEAVLVSTFMEDELLENGLTYAEYFLQVGAELNVDPIYLAVKARQEQGTGGTSPVISGTCGALLNRYYQNNTQYSEAGNAILTPSEGHTSEELLALDGLYNIYNNNAYGNGLFTIYYRAMKRAEKGTADMMEAWGSPAWNTIWKSIYGGAYSIKTSYIDRYQNTIYLQKFNVDSRSDRNFWGQYMQNVGGALTEARRLYTSFASNGALDSKCSFQIPVFEGMPHDACPDPANGTCSYLATADRKYDYSFSLDEPFLRTEANRSIYLSHELYTGSTLNLRGSVTHSYGVKGLEYRWDDEEWIPLSDSDSFEISLPNHFSEGSSHILVIRGIAAYDHSVSAKKSNYNFLCAVIYVDVVPPPSANLRLQTQNGVTETTYPIGSEITLPDCEENGFVAWYGSDATLLPPQSSFTLEEDCLYQAFYLNIQQPDGAALIFSDGAVQLRFYAAIEKQSLEILNSAQASVRFTATLSNEEGDITIPVLMGNTVDAHGSSWQMLYANTPHLTERDWDVWQSVSFTVTLTYSDGSEQTLLLTPTPVSRSAREVAERALADSSTVYPMEIFQKLLQIAPNTK